MSFAPISISLSPNTEKDDIFFAFKLIFQPWKWNKGKAIEELEEKFKKYLGVKYAFSFNSGRTAFLAILKSLGLNSNDEVLLQAFTCNAAVNPILWSGKKIKYIDCDESDFNIDIEDLKKEISPSSKVLTVQHTFGMPADMDKIQSISNENNLILIEDCAHSLGAEYNSRKVGTFGKAAFFSFSRDKIISSVYGGMVITNDSELAKKIGEFRNNISYPSYFWVFQQLLHPILLNCVVLPIYNFIDLGKIFLVLSQKLNILSKAVHFSEKKGMMPLYFPKKMPNALCLLAIKQFDKLDYFNEHREKIANFYYERLKRYSFLLPKKFSERKNVFLRFSVIHPKAHPIIFEAWNKENILIGDWYTTPIAPSDTDLEKMNYKTGMCPKAEGLALKTFNLPTHINISLKKAQKIVNFLEKFN